MHDNTHPFELTQPAELTESGIVPANHAPERGSLRPFFANPELLNDFRKGKKRTLELVYQAYFGDVTRMVRFGFAIDSQRSVDGVSHPGEQAELVQEIFTHAFGESSRQQYDSRNPYSAHLFAIAKSVMADHVRKVRYNRPTSLDRETILEGVLKHSADRPGLSWSTAALFAALAVAAAVVVQILM